MKGPAPKSLPAIGFGLIALLWVVLTLIVLVGSITGGDPLYTALPGGTVLPNLSLLGKLYLGLSVLMPFVVLGALVAA
ncbi:MAG TPA: hypothetical protein VKT21_02835 [Thermoplasmata archaeon]|nr:hypothetical protein [Thermoplasmata archaeon]